jgi:predicted SAM-dependent methyltransferase|tara:strand:- start:212 stop:820 length:609 start_codon:yes stop_codon:yes gene_type:complete
MRMTEPERAQRMVALTQALNADAPAPRRLHLGCGTRHIPGFFHIDLVPHSHVDWLGSVERLDPIADDSVDLIYASHVLEHFGRYQVFDVVSEWYRVLRPGGVLRVAVPDFEAAAGFYLADGDIRHVLGLIMGGQTAPHDYHYAIFDETNLGELLADVGFERIRRYDWRQTEHAWLDDFSQAYLPHMDKDNGTLVSLNVEAVK